MPKIYMGYRDFITMLIIGVLSFYHHKISKFSGADMHSTYQKTDYKGGHFRNRTINQ